MGAPLILLKVVGKAAANFVGGGVAGDVLFDVLPDVATEAWKWWSRQRNPQERQADLQALAQTPTVALRAQVAEVVEEVAGDKPAATQEALQIYLSLIPGQLRKSMRRPGDPQGQTVPQERVPQQADDLIPLLPARLPRFKAEDRPLAGVDWVLEELLGVGGFGEVWKARNPLLASAPPVALKFCLDEQAARLLRHEAAVLDRVMRQGRHDGIVPLQHTYLSAQTPCLEYEFISGGDLAGLIVEWHRCGTRPTAEEVARIVADLAETVGFAHRLTPPIVHRDLKPANILRVAADDGSVKLKVADFGIGGVASQQAIRQSTRGTTRGEFLISALRGSCTPLYASIQQMRGDDPDPRDDVFSLGVIWYQMLTGDLTAGRPGGSRWQRRLAEQGMPAGLIEVLAECFEDDRSDRIPTGQALAERLRALVGPGAVRLSAPAAPPGPAGPLTRVGVTVHAPVGQHTGRWGEAPASLDAAPSSRVVELLRSAEVNRQRGSLEHAIADCTEAIRLEPRHSRVWWNRGEAYRLKGDHDRAIADCTEAIRLDPTLAPAFSTRGWAQRMKNQPEAAIADCSEAIKLDPKDARAWYNRGEANRLKGQFDRAVADCTEAIRLDPGFPQAYGTRGAAYRARGDHDLALADLDENLRLDPAYAWAWAVRGETHRLKGDFDRAIADCTEALRLAPRYGLAYATRGAAFRQKGDFATAMADLTEALRLAPGDRWAKDQLDLARRRHR
jgi:tetratricopeptide (TPR) repeat protein